MTLTKFIENDLKAIVLSGRELPFPLTLNGISEHYDVSPMPVRTAVGSLVEQGVLHKGTNGRLERGQHTSVAPTEAPGDGWRPQPVRDHEQEITELTIRVSLGGEEQFLREHETSERLDIGRSVVRGIFGRLAGAGLLEHVPRRGWKVRPFRERDIFDYIEVREVLEPKALDLARHRLDPDDLHDMIALNQRGPDGEPRVDNRLHYYWIEHSGNRYIQDFFRLHGPFYETLFDCATLAESSLAANAEQHREILGHLLDRDWDRAKQALRDHIQRQQPKVVKLIASYKALSAGALR